jgi:hypothetical protein
VTALLTSKANAAETAEPTTPEAKEHLRVGVLAAAGFPRPFAIEGMVKVERLLGVGLEYGLFPKTTISGVDVNMWSLAGDARVFPFKGAFFFGLRAGLQSATASTQLTIANYGALTESMTVNTWFVNPRMGFLWTWKPGLSLGIDAGVQLPIASNTSSSLPAQLVANQNVTNATDLFAKTPLPTIDLLQIGLLL